MTNDELSEREKLEAYRSELQIEVVERRADMCDAKRRLVETQTRTYPLLVVCTLIILASVILMVSTSS